MEPQSPEECIKEIVRLASLMGWTFGSLDPEDKSQPVTGMVIGTPEFCDDSINIISNFLNTLGGQEECTDQKSSKTSDADAQPSDA